MKTEGGRDEEAADRDSRFQIHDRGKLSIRGQDELFAHAKRQGKVLFHVASETICKSLTISTYDCMFRGEKELFKGTWLYDNWDFDPGPYSPDMSELDARNERTLEDNINYLLDELYVTHGIERDTNMMKMAFATLIKRLYERYANVWWY